MIAHPTPLIHGTVVARPNRFIVEALVGEEVVRAHCPVSGRIGGLTLDTLPVLLSGPYLNRGTSHTVEAFALEEPTSPTFQWIGINQSRCNRVVEDLLTSRALSAAFPEANEATVRREKNLLDSRIDFLIADRTFVEVKMPLLSIHAHRPPSVPMKTFKDGNPSERLPKQLRAMEAAMARGYRGAMIVVFQYANTAETSMEEQLHSNIFSDEALQHARGAGLEQWVCETRFTEDGIDLVSMTRM